MFKKIGYAILHFFGIIACDYYWPMWSNLRWKKVERRNVGIADNEKIETLMGVLIRSKKIKKVFNWTKDGINQLYDSIVPPSQLYIDYKHNDIRDDCDGFHSALYHFLYNSKIPCYLLAVAAIGAGHCVLLFKLNNKWHVCDYTCIYDGYDTAAEAIRAYNKEFINIYVTKSPVYHNSLLYYDYGDKKFKSVRRSKQHRHLIMNK